MKSYQCRFQIYQNGYCDWALTISGDQGMESKIYMYIIHTTIHPAPPPLPQPTNQPTNQPTATCGRSCRTSSSSFVQSYITFAYESAPNSRCRQYKTCDFFLLYPLKGLLPIDQYSWHSCKYDHCLCHSFTFSLPTLQHETGRLYKRTNMWSVQDIERPLTWCAARSPSQKLWSLKGPACLGALALHNRWQQPALQSPLGL